MKYLLLLTVLSSVAQAEDLICSMTQSSGEQPITRKYFGYTYEEVEALSTEEPPDGFILHGCVDLQEIHEYAAGRKGESLNTTLDPWNSTENYYTIQGL